MKQMKGCKDSMLILESTLVQEFSVSAPEWLDIRNNYVCVKVPFVQELFIKHVTGTSHLCRLTQNPSKIHSFPLAKAS
jgi:hypothetical protein